MLWNHTNAATMVLIDGSYKFPSIRNTFLVRGEDGDIHLRYVDTNVVTIHADNTFTLRTDGHETPTTKRRMNMIMRGFDLSVYQEKGEWFVWNYKTEEKWEFYEGIRFSADGDIVDPEDYEHLNPDEDWPYSVEMTVDNQINKTFL